MSTDLLKLLCLTIWQSSRISLSKQRYLFLNSPGASEVHNMNAVMYLCKSAMPISSVLYIERLLLFFYVIKKMQTLDVCVLQVRLDYYTCQARKLERLKNISRGSSHRIFWKRYFITLDGQAILQLLWRSCVLWYPLWLFSSIFEANYIIMQKENGFIAISLVIFCILWLHCM